MIDVVFALDVEDVYNPESDDALLAQCRLFEAEGVQISLFVAGEKARATRYGARLPFDEAVGLALSVESKGLHDVVEITDRRFGSTNMPPDWDMTRLWDLLKWQSWSYRPAVANSG